MFSNSLSLLFILIMVGSNYSSNFLVAFLTIDPLVATACYTAYRLRTRPRFLLLSMMHTRTYGLVSTSSGPPHIVALL